MPGYYDETLSAERLRLVYETAPPRVRRYLDAEVAHVRERIRPGDRVLELGCGYGRALAPLEGEARLLAGVDTSVESLRTGAAFLAGFGSARLAAMDALALGFADGVFDLVFCIQNGISAFHADRRELVREAARVARPGGRILFSSYAERFWEDRLDWFERQARAGLIGEIDRERTGRGIIVCRDGFTATTIAPEEFLSLAAGLGLAAEVSTVDESSLFCEIVRPCR
jgi:2-polyprenyl-6-hydroxyphenyl methylase/3-demethylubiquinone-9 3-methyltransferase